VSAPAKTKGTRKTENKKVAQKKKKDRDTIEDMLAKKVLMLMKKFKRTNVKKRQRSSK
jgi:hypothetical protein